MTPLERADKVRDCLRRGALDAALLSGREHDPAPWDEAQDSMPSGSLILTPDEAKKVRALIPKKWVSVNGDWKFVERPEHALLAAKGQT